jgi:hypothetical protein
VLNESPGRALDAFGPFVLSMPKRKNTSEQVTRIDMQMSTMMIQVILDILSSDM